MHRALDTPNKQNKSLGGRRDWGESFTNYNLGISGTAQGAGIVVCQNLLFCFDYFLEFCLVRVEIIMLWCRN